MAPAEQQIIWEVFDLIYLLTVYGEGDPRSEAMWLQSAFGEVCRTH